MEVLRYTMIVLSAYLLGSIPTGYLLARFRGVDIREVGSGNIGATNVFRILGKKAGTFVLLADALKGFIACYFLGEIAEELFRAEVNHEAAPREYYSLVAGLAAILGHNYTCWLKFKGGKGIATSAGVLIALVPWALLIILAIWIMVFGASRYVSLASISAAFALPFAVWLTRGTRAMVLIMAGVGALAIYKHKANIQRLLHGTEPRVGAKHCSRIDDMKVTVLGAGAWGTALAQLLHHNQHQVTLWGHNRECLADLRTTQCNNRYLPGITLPVDVRLEDNLLRSIEGCECIVVAVPSKAFRQVTEQIAEFSGILVSVTKGIEYDTGLTMSGVAQANAPKARVAALSGPTLALEVARGIPSAIVAASHDLATARTVQQVFHRPAFRVYTSGDLLGVELGGALKNVIAIGAGMCDGLGFGDNSKAALITRAIVEIRRVGVACGAQAETFAGLSGLGDLTVTCFSRLSRNRGLGERLGRGEKLAEILRSTVTVAEGYPTARSAYRLAHKSGMDTPIIDEVYAMLYEGKDVAQVVRDLTGRDFKAEDGAD